MTLLVRIFSIYIIWLAVAPCDDGGVQFVKSPYETQAVEPCDTHDKAGNDFDSCSFFCLCNCCGAIFILSTTDLLCPPHSLSVKQFVSSVVDPLYMNFPLLRPPKVLLS